LIGLSCPINGLIDKFVRIAAGTRPNAGRPSPPNLYQSSQNYMEKPDA